MKKALVHYFSGTGNSFLAAKQLTEELIKYNYEVTFHPIEKGLYDNIEVYALHIFFFPVYATAMPHIMARYMRNLPNGKDAKTVVISTNGKISTRFRDGYQGWALHQARLYLSLKNYKVFFSDTLDYPHNVTVFGPPRKEKANEEILYQISARFPLMVEKIAKGEKKHRKFFFPNIIWSLPFSLLFSFFARHLIGKMFEADCNCSLCGQCKEKCPVKAIKMNSKKITWRWNCEGCLRCINSCPRHAVQVSAVRVLASIIAAFLNPFVLFHNIFSEKFIGSLGNIGVIVFNVLMYAAFFIITFVIMDWLINILSFVPVFKKVISWGHTRYYGRYNAKEFEKKVANKK